MVLSELVLKLERKDNKRYIINLIANCQVSSTSLYVIRNQLHLTYKDGNDHLFIRKKKLEELPEFPGEKIEIHP